MQSAQMESLEVMQSRHRREQKDLQSRVTQKKKGATKKTRKGVATECEELERQLKERQEQERAALDGDAVPEENGDLDDDDEPSTNDVNGVAQTLSETTISESIPSENGNGQPRKRNRQKERLARRAAEQEAAVEEAKKEAANQPDPKAIEREMMQAQFKTRGLTEKLIRPDGHCLFSAVADQLSQVGIPIEDADANAEGQRYKAVRKAAAKYIKDHPDDFLPFLAEPLGEYVVKIRDHAEWGGHLELLALANTYNVEICVLQNGEAQTIEPGTQTKDPEKIWLAYYRHGFGLGEHYNSLRKTP